MIRDLSSTLSLCTEYLTRVAVQLEVRKRAEANRRNERIEALFQMIATLKRNKLKESRYVVHECTHTHIHNHTHTHRAFLLHVKSMRAHIPSMYALRYTYSVP